MPERKQQTKICPFLTIATAGKGPELLKNMPGLAPGMMVHCQGENCQLWWFCKGPVLSVFTREAP